MSRSEQLTAWLVDNKLLDKRQADDLVTEVRQKGRELDVSDFSQILLDRGVISEYQCEHMKEYGFEGLRLGNYLIRDRLGTGGMGEVYVAEHLKMKRTVAIKVLPACLTQDINFIERFQREVQVSARLMHPNIVAAFDADVVNGRYFLAMEYVDGKDLSRVLKEYGPLNIERTIHVILDAAKGLAHAHSMGVIHRDIKPSNLLLVNPTVKNKAETDKFTSVKVLDMGLARITQDLAHTNDKMVSELTQTGIILGTVDFMSPEQALDLKSVDQRTDIYGLGMTLYYLLAGQPAYPGGSALDRLMKHREAPIPSLQDICPEVSDNLNRIYAKMVEKEVEDRFQSMNEVILALEDEKQQIVDRGPTRPAGIHSKSGTQNRKLKWLWAGLVTVCLMAGLLFAMNHTGKKVAEEPTSQIVLSNAGQAVKPKTDLTPLDEAETLPTKETIQALKFTGKTIVNVPYVEVPQGESYTIECWIVNEQPEVTGHPFYESGHIFGWIFNQGIKLFSLGGRIGLSSHLKSDDNNGWINASRSEQPLEPGWLHLAAIQTPSEYRLFINGQVATEITLEPGVKHVYPGEEPFGKFGGPFLGGIVSVNNFNEPTGGGGFIGFIRHARVSVGARYVPSGFSPQWNLEADTDTLALYKLDEGTGIIARDSGRFRLDAQIVGGKWEEIEPQ